MPAGLVNTPEEEECWNRAKEIATVHFGKPPATSNQWAYTMGIYKHMCLLLEEEESSEEITEEEIIQVRIPRRKRGQRRK
tara:strand:+ start:574 stop:813 length:240 start_codon:yes stop_codon:yes gene_type:complete